MKKVSAWFASTSFAVLLSIFGNQSFAGSILLEPSFVPGAPVGLILNFDVKIDFTSDPTMGGGIDIMFNPVVLTYLDFTFNPLFPDDNAFARKPDAEGGGILNSLAFGNFGGLSTGVVGTLTFLATAPGISQVMLMADGGSSIVAGDFFSVTGARQSPSFGGAFVAVVPEPELWALMLAGLGLVGFIARRRKQFAA
jgi:hypothetical protein